MQRGSHAIPSRVTRETVTNGGGDTRDSIGPERVVRPRGCGDGWLSSDDAGRPALPKAAAHVIGPARGRAAKVLRRRSPRLLRLAERVRPGADPIFDPDWYVARYPDVAAAGLDPWRHYRELGVAEGRFPVRFLDTDWYLAVNPDVARSGLDPLTHYRRHGWREGRSPGPAFDTRWYLDRYPDVREAGVDPLGHYLRHGAREGRAFGPLPPDPDLPPAGFPIGRGASPPADGAARRVLIAIDDGDHGGQGHRIATLLARHAPDWFPRTVHRRDTYLRYPSDLRWDERVVRSLWERADLIHLRHSFEPLERYGVKPAIMHHHGTAFRSDPDRHMALSRRYGLITVVATIDLTLVDDSLEWLPSPHDVPWLASIREAVPRPDDGRIRICHAPTNRSIKSTDLFLRICEELKARYPIEVVLIERTPWHEALRRKATADIVFDQTMFTFANTSIEAFAMGIPVIAGGAPATIERQRGLLGPDLPFLEATDETLRDALVRLIEDGDLRTEYARRGRGYVTRWHDYPVVAARLRAIYQRALSR